MFATDLILEAVDHVLKELSRGEKLWKKLNHWKTSGKDYDGGKESEYCCEKGSMAFDLLTEVHKQLQKTPMGTYLLS